MGSAADHLEAGQALAAVVGEFHRRGWCVGTAGNFSVRVSEDPLQLLLTQSGREKRALEAPGDFVLVDEAGRPAPGDRGKPSAEALLHGTIAAACGAGSVLHVHSVANTLLGEHFLVRGGFTITGYEMLKGFAGIETHEARVRVPVFANTQDMSELAADIRPALNTRGGAPGFLIAGHGLYAWGKDLSEARRHVEIFEFLFEVLSRRVPFTPFEG